jgi:hypothetical protein
MVESFNPFTLLSFQNELRVLETIEQIITALLENVKNTETETQLQNVSKGADIDNNSINPLHLKMILLYRQEQIQILEYSQSQVRILVTQLKNRNVKE